MNLSIPGKGKIYLASLVSGLIAPLAFAPFDFYPAIFLSLTAIIFICLHTTPRAAFTCGFLFGLGFFGAGVSWLHISINLFGGVNIIGAVVLTFLLVAFLSLYPAITGHLVAKYSKARPCTSILFIPALWTLSEWTRGWVFTGFPWLNLGYSQTDTVLAGLAALTGVLGISFMVVLTATSLARLVDFNRSVKYSVIILVISTWLAIWVLADRNWTNADGRSLSVTLVQGAVPQEIKWRPDMRTPTMELYTELTRPHLQSDLIIWPEAAIPAYYHQVPEFMDRLRRLTSEHGNHLLTGIPVYESGSDEYFNSVVLLSGETSFYFKKHLVPFGEYLPVKLLLQPFIDYFRIPMSDFSPGPDVAPLLDAGAYRIGISICYEDTFGKEVIQALPAADVLVNVSNDAWFGDSAAPHQHLQMARMRARETGRYLLRATNTGISAIIDEKGNIVNSINQFIPDTVSHDVPLFSGHTPYSRLGNYPVIIFSLLLVLVIIPRHRKNKQADQP